MKIGIITAMPEEFRAVANSLGTVACSQKETLRSAHFSAANHDFLLVEAGIGFDNAARATEMLILTGYTDLLISTGFCGGIAPELQAGDVVVAKAIFIVAEHGYEDIPVQLSDISHTFVAQQAVLGTSVVGGTFFSTAVIRTKARLAEMLPDHLPNRIVEMESGAIAIVAAEHNIPLLAIRAVSDAATEELDFSLDELCDKEMRRILLYKVLLTALRKPRIIPQLVRLGFSSSKAAKSLTAAFHQLLPAIATTAR